MKFIHTYIHTYVHNTYINTYVHTYIHTYIRTYVHIYNDFSQYFLSYLALRFVETLHYSNIFFCYYNQFEPCLLYSLRKNALYPLLGCLVVVTTAGRSSGGWRNSCPRKSKFDRPVFPHAGYSVRWHAAWRSAFWKLFYPLHLKYFVLQEQPTWIPALNVYVIDRKWTNVHKSIKFRYFHRD